jgi:hypothetical protein
MSFVLTNALAYFMYLMNKVFMEYFDKFFVVFINDRSTIRMKKNTNNISVCYCNSFETIDYLEGRNTYGSKQDSRCAKFECTC